MFIGHYGPAFAGKAIEKRLPLWLLFIAVQWLDVMWSALVMLNVEKLRIVKGFTEGSSLDLYYMPFTHGLIGALALSALLGAIATLYGDAPLKDFRVWAYQVNPEEVSVGDPIDLSKRLDGTKDVRSV